MSGPENISFNLFENERKPGKIVRDCVYFLEYTIGYYFASASSLCRVMIAPFSAISASHTILSPFSIFNKLTIDTGIVVVIDPFTFPALVLYVIFIHLIIFFFHIYFYMSPYICTYVFPFVIPYGLYKMRYRSIHMEIFNKNLGMILMRNKNLQRMCVCTTSQIKRVSKLKINFVENLGKLLFLKTSQFHYITYNIYYYISMIFLYLNYYIYLPILQFNSISEVNTSEHLLTSDVTLLIKEWCTSEHFVNTSEHLLTNIGGSL